MSKNDQTASPAPRVVLLTSPGLFGAEIINRLADASGINLVGVGLTGRIYKNKGNLASILTFLKRTGWRYLSYNALQADVAWTILRLSGRPHGLEKVAGQVRSLHDVNAPSTLDWLKSLTPDYVASFFFNQWIGADVRKIPHKGCINLHPSLLPELRGPDPVFRTIERGVTSTGFTIHSVADEIDAGTILHQQPFAAPPGLTAFGLYLQLIRGGADLLARWLSGDVPPDLQRKAASGAGDYSTFPTPNEVSAYFQAGHRLVRLAEWRSALAQVR
jgi:hypothetical protein